MLNLTLNEINCKKGNVDGYKGMSKNELINLISPTSRGVFKIVKRLCML